MNRYLILKPVGQGGMGAVYQALDKRLGNKVVAVKEMSDGSISDPQEKQEARANFEQEAQLLANLIHPHLPRVSDHFLAAGRSYIVMEFIQGETLEEKLVQANGPLKDIEQVVRWALQLCDVLGYLHDQQPPIIFRDLKPGNIMVDTQGQVKLIDFGIARHFKQGKKLDTLPLGTEGYAPPEQFGKGQTDARSDIYALGVTLHHLLTARDPVTTPFKFPLIRTLAPMVPESVERAIMRAVEVKPEHRWQKMKEMRDALDPSQNATALPAPIRAVPPRAAPPVSAVAASPSAKPQLPTPPPSPPPSQKKNAGLSFSPSLKSSTLVPTFRALTQSSFTKGVFTHLRTLFTRSDKWRGMAFTGALLGGVLGAGAGSGTSNLAPFVIAGGLVGAYLGALGWGGILGGIIGVSIALDSNNFVLVVLGLTIGGIIGSLLGKRGWWTIIGAILGMILGAVAGAGPGMFIGLFIGGYLGYKRAS